MQMNVRVLMAVLLFASFFGRPLEALSQSQTACSLISFKDGETVSLSGKAVYGAHDLLLTVKGCDEAVILKYAGDVDSGKARNNLARNEEFEKFRRYVGSTYTKVGKGSCEQCPKYEVEAMLTGRLDVASDAFPQGQWKDKLGYLHDQSGKLVGQAGFGHPPIYKYRLIIDSVSQVTARKLPKPKVADKHRSSEPVSPSARDEHASLDTQLHEAGHSLADPPKQ